MRKKEMSRQKSEPYHQPPALDQEPDSALCNTHFWTEMAKGKKWPSGKIAAECRGTPQCLTNG